MNKKNNSKKGSRLVKALSRVERFGNKMPDPALLFVVFGVAILIISAITASLGLSVINPVSGETVKAVSLLNGEGIRKIIENILPNLANFAPLPSVICIMMGIGVAEGSGLLTALLNKTTSKLPRRLVLIVIIFIAINSNLASDSGFVVLPPIAAMIFLSMGKHPYIGIAAVFASVAAGFNANLFLCTGDVILAGMTESAAQIIDPNITINPAVNYYFMAASVIPLTLIGAWVTKKFIEPRFPTIEGIENHEERLTELTELEHKGLRRAGIAALVLIIIIGIGIIPSNGVLRDPETGGIITSSLITGMVFFMMLIFLIPGIIYGKTVGVIKKDADVVRLAAEGVSSVSGFIVLAFVASQFIAWFGWSNLGTIISIGGAEWLQNAGLTGIPLAIGIVILCMVLDIFMGSQTAKWALVSTIFVPMLMLVDFHPAYTQVLYRIGDSVANPISPLFTFFPLLVGYLKKYDKNAGMGTAISLMLPYTITFLITWLIMLIGWTLLNIPLGPGGFIWM